MNFAQWVGFSVLVIILYILWQIRNLLLLLFTAVILANALNHGVKQFQNWGIKRGYAVLISMILLLATLCGFFWLIVPPFAEQLPELFKLVPKGIERLITTLREQVSYLDPEFRQALPSIEKLTEQLQPLAQQILGKSLSVFYTTLGIPLSILFLLVLSLMLLANPQPYRKGFIRLFPYFYRRRIDKILVQCDQVLQGWLMAVLFNMTIITILSFIGLSILKIPLSLAQALLAGIFTFIPNIGPTLSVIPPIAIALLEAPWKSIAVLILYILIQQLESHLLTPLMMFRQASLLPAVTLLAQLFFATIFGVLGLLLALPLAVVGQVWFKEVLIKDILDKWQPLRQAGEAEGVGEAGEAGEAGDII